MGNVRLTRDILALIMHRRRFVILTGGALASWAVPAEGRADEGVGHGEKRLFRRASRALGTDVSITVYHVAEKRAKIALNAAFAELEHVERLMSLYRRESQLSRLNRDGILRDPHPYLLEVLKHAMQISRRTRGAFDVTVQPLWELHRDVSAEQRRPTQSELALATSKVDWHRVNIDKDRIALKGSGTAVTLNGIAQGFAADRVAMSLRRYGVADALIDTGEVGAFGNNAGAGWRIGIQHPRQVDAYVSLTRLDGRCLATSGDYATNFNDDYSSHHLFDPRTGRAANCFSSVSILAATAMEADALSTAVFVMGRDDGVELVRSLPHVDALLVMKDGTVRATEGFPVVSA